MVVCGRGQHCVVDTVLCLRLMPVMHRHQLALCESEKEGSLCEVEALPAGIAYHSADQPVTSPGNYSRAYPCCRLKQVVNST